MSGTQAEKFTGKISHLNKSEVKAALQELEKWQPKMASWTASELMEELKTQLKPAGEPGEDINKEIRRLERLKKSDMLLEVEGYLTLDGTETRGKILGMYRKALEENLLQDDHQPMGFGKYQGKTFLEVKTLYPGYEGFCRDCWEKDPMQCCPEMVRFLAYLDQTTVQQMRELIKQERENPVPAGASASSGLGARAKTALRPPMRVKVEEQETPAPKPKAKSHPTAVKTGFPKRFNIHTPPAPAEWMQVEVPEDDNDQEI